MQLSLHCARLTKRLCKKLTFSLMSNLLVQVDIVIHPQPVAMPNEFQVFSLVS